MTPLDPPTYFIDRALGKSIGQALQAQGIKIEFHNDHFSPDSPDTEWLPIVSNNQWIVLTKDKNIGRNSLEIQAIAQSNAKVFILVAGNLTRQAMIDIFLKAIAPIERMTQGNHPPFIAKIYKDGRVQLWKNRTALTKLLKGEKS